MTARGYPSDIVQKAKKHCRNNHREALLDKVQRMNTDNCLICITTYSVAANHLKKIINKWGSILNSGEFNLQKPLLSFKRTKNLRDLLIHTRPPSKNISPMRSANLQMEPITGHYPCGSCKVCHLTTHNKTIRLNDCETWTQNTHTNCNSKIFIYLVTCPSGKICGYDHKDD